jgi:tetratricopeptide (TPR) repeat protein
MAAKVNTKFVVGLAVGVLVVFAGVAYLGYSTVSKSAADHARLAEGFEAAGDFEKAAGSWSRAVNKQRTNVEYLKRWSMALRKWTPSSSETYRQKFRGDYAMAMQSLADAAPNDVTIQREYLDQLLSDIRLTPSNQGWEALVTRAESAIKGMPETDPKRESLRRYLAIARTNQLLNTADPNDQQVEQAQAELTAALKADPNDPLVAGAQLDWFRFAAVRERVRANNDAAAGYIRQANEFLDRYLASAPLQATVRFTQIQMEMEASRRGLTRSADIDALFAEQHKRLAALFDRIDSEPIDSLDRITVWSAAKFAIAANMPEGHARGTKALERLLQQRPNDVLTLFNLGELDMSAGKFDKAIERYGQLADLKNLPLSPEGMMLFSLREEARARQCDCSLALWQTAKEPAEKAKHLDTAKKYRDQFVALAGPATTRGMLIEGKLKFAEADYVEARRLLAQYNDQTTPPRTDLPALKLLGEVLRRQGNLGGARQQFERVLELTGNRDLESLFTLADIEGTLQNLPAARKHLEQILELQPSNPGATDRLAQIKDIQDPNKAENPVIRSLGKMQELMSKVPPDIEGARKLAREAVDSLDMTPEVALSLANRLMVLEDKPKAREAINKGLAKSPDNPRLKQALAMIDSPDPIAAQLEAIDASANFPDVAKEMLKYQLYQRLKNPDKMKEHLTKAQAMDKEHPLVIGALFDEALAAKNIPEARRLADLATAKNLDKVNGLVFRTRMEITDGRLREAAALAQQAVDADALNPVCWRLLAAVRMANGQFPEAVTAFEKAVQIRPTDMEAIKGLARARINAQQFTEALNTVRDALPLAGDDADFGDLWVTLEGEVGDRARAIDVRRRAFERNPKERTNAIDLAQLYLRSDNYPEARKIIDVLRAEKYDLAVAQLEGLWLVGVGRGPEARKAFDDYIASLPSEQRTIELYVAEARFLANVGQLGSAIEVLKANRDKQKPDVMEIDREAGDIAFSAGRWDEAVEFYTSALKGIKKDEDGRLTMRLIEAQLKSGKYQQAEDLAAKMDTGGRPNMALLLLRSEAAYGLGDKTRAAQLLDKAVEAESTNPLAYFKRAQFKAMSEETRRDAVADVEQAMRLNARFVPARVLLANLLLDLKEEDRAIQLLKEGVGLEPRNDNLRREYIDKLVALNRFNDALAALAEAREKSRDPRWRILTGDMLDRQGDPAKAADFYAEAWNDGYEQPDLAVKLVDSTLRTAKPDMDRVRKVMKDMEKIVDENFGLLMLRARVARIEKRPADVEKDARAAFALVDQTNVNMVGLFFQELQRLSANLNEAMALCNAIRPKEGFGDLSRIMISRMIITDPSRRAEAIKNLDEVIAGQGDKAAVATALRTTGDLLYFQKQYEAAVEVYRRFLKLQPNDPSINNNLAYTLSKHLNRHQEALPLALSSVQAQPDNPNALDTLGSVQLALGELRDADETLQKALKVASTPDRQVPVLLHLAEVRAGQGDRGKAEDYFQQAQRALVRDPRVRAMFDEEIRRVEKKLKEL